MPASSCIQWRCAVGQARCRIWTPRTPPSHDNIVVAAEELQTTRCCDLWSRSLPKKMTEMVWTMLQVRQERIGEHKPHALHNKARIGQPSFVGTRDPPLQGKRDNMIPLLNTIGEHRHCNYGAAASWPTPNFCELTTTLHTCLWSPPAPTAGAANKGDGRSSIAGRV
jgi:hypothetical protein